MENLNVGITIMVIGMSMVFVFLMIMIVAMNITTRIIGVINKYFPEPIPEENTRNKKINSKSDDTEVALAIAVAMREKVGCK